MLSRFDKLMVTLLLGEIAGGAFGRSLATLGGESDSEGSAKLDTSGSRPRPPSPGTAQAAPAAASGAGSGAGQGTEPAVAELTAKLDAATKAMAKASATAAGGIAARQLPEVAKTLHDMQRKYLENLNFDVLEVACVSALDRDLLSPNHLKEVLAFSGLHLQYQAQLKEYQEQLKKNPKLAPPPPPVELVASAGRVSGLSTDTRHTALASFCMTSLIPMIQAQKGQLLSDILTRAAKERDEAGTRAAVAAELDYAKQYLEKLKGLADAVK
jgi:hypothetical protein